MADNARLTTDVEMVVEFVRTKLADTICSRFRGQDNTVHVITVCPTWEQLIQDSTVRTANGSFLTIDPTKGMEFLESLRDTRDSLDLGLDPPALALLVAPPVRASLRKLTERCFKDLAVLSWNEIASGVNVYSHAMIE